MPTITTLSAKGALRSSVICATPCSPLLAPKPGQHIQVRYDGISGLAPVTLRFE